MSARWSKVVVVLACWWLGCGAPAAAAGKHVVFVISLGWHTEIAIPTPMIEGPLKRLAAAFPAAPYLGFGWGARDFYMARNPGLGDLLRAAVPGPAVMLVTPIAVPPTTYLAAGQVWALPVAQRGGAGLSQFLWDSLARDHGAVIPAGPGPYPQSVFYAATGTYDASDTCNTWTAEALRAAGVPVSAAGVVFAGQLTRQLPPFSVTALNAANRR